MYSHVEAVESVDEDFLNALALLHSSDEGSAEQLKNMLNASIDDKKSMKNIFHERTTTFHNYSTGLNNIVREFEDQIKLLDGALQNRDSSFSSNESNVGSSDICDDEIPRISIPDECTNDGSVCKICNGDKLGPLILLECQECQDLYHPLCHQPPVVDIDVYDPRLVWRCGKCIEMSDKQAEALIFTKDEGQMISVDRKGSRFFNEKLGKEELTEQSCFRRTRSRSGNHVTAVKRISVMTHKNSSIPMRKRIGSRLSVTRAVSSAK